MTNNTSFVNPFTSNEKAHSYMPGYGDISISNLPAQPYEYDNSKEAVQDNAYIIFLFPEEARKVKEIVAKALDKLDYEGSVIYHEYPDKNNLEEILNEIYQQINAQMPQTNESTQNMTPSPNNTINTPPNMSNPSTMPTPSTMPSTTVPPTTENTPPTSESVSTMQIPTFIPPCRGYDCPPPYYSPSHFPDGRPNWIRQLLESLFFDEMINRRRKYFNKKYR